MLVCGRPYFSIPFYNKHWRIIASDINVSGYHIPAGTTVYTNNFDSHLQEMLDTLLLLRNSFLHIGWRRRRTFIHFHQCPLVLVPECVMDAGLLN